MKTTFSQPHYKNQEKNITKMQIVGIGGGGSNIIDYIANDTNNTLCNCTAINTDRQHLSNMKNSKTLLIGKKSIGGYGSGMDCEEAHKAFNENREDIKYLIEDTNILFISACLGGGTGTGVIADIAKLMKEINKDTLIYAIVTKPFNDEGNARIKLAENCIKDLSDSKNVDFLVVLPNNVLEEITCKEENISASDRYDKINEIVKKYAISLINLITKASKINNIDLRDIKKIATFDGKTKFTFGNSIGEKRIEKAYDEAIKNKFFGLEKNEIITNYLIEISAQDTIKAKEEDYIKNEIKNLCKNDTNGELRKISLRDNCQEYEQGEIKIVTIIKVCSNDNQQIKNNKKQPKKDNIDREIVYSISATEEKIKKEYNNINFPAYLRIKHEEMAKILSF